MVMKVQKCIVVEHDQYELLRQKYINGFNFSEWVRDRINEEVSKAIEIEEISDEERQKRTLRSLGIPLEVLKKGTSIPDRDLQQVGRPDRAGTNKPNGKEDRDIS